MPRAKGVRGEYDRTTRAEVAKFLASGGWSNYIKSDEEIRKTHPEAFVTSTGKPRDKRTCGCGQPMSKATVSTHVKRLCYDTGIEEKRHPHNQRASRKNLHDNKSVGSRDRWNLQGSCRPTT